MSVSKQFYIKASDLDFLSQQITAPRIMIVRYDAAGKAVYGLVWTDASGFLHTDELGYSGSFDPLGVINPLTSEPLYASARVADGLRETSGNYNNLIQGWQAFGASEAPFMREMTKPDYNHYVNESADNPAFVAFQTAHGNPLNPTDNSADYSNPTLHVVDYTPRMISQTIVNSGFVGNMPDDPDHPTNYANDAFAAALAAQSDASEGIGDPQTFIRSLNTRRGRSRLQHVVRAVRPVLRPRPRLRRQAGLKPRQDHDPARPGRSSLRYDRSGRTAGSRADRHPRHGQQSEATPDRTAGSAPPTMSGTAPVRTALQGTADDVYAVPQYTNHTSPFIDQSQTYGSEEQVTLLLRDWVPDPNHPGQYIPGARLLDGHTLGPDATWHLPDGTETDQTLPTLNELRAHLVATGRDDLTWDDINDYRARDAQGHVIDVDSGTPGVQAALTGHSIILDMNPHFDAAHIEPIKLMALDAHITSVDLGTGR